MGYMFTLDDIRVDVCPNEQLHPLILKNEGVKSSHNRPNCGNFRPFSAGVFPLVNDLGCITPLCQNVSILVHLLRETDPLLDSCFNGK